MVFSIFSARWFLLRIGLCRLFLCCAAERHFLRFSGEWKEEEQKRKQFFSSGSFRKRSSLQLLHPSDDLLLRFVSVFLQKIRRMEEMIRAKQLKEIPQISSQVLMLDTWRCSQFESVLLNHSVFSFRWVLHLQTLQPVGGPRRLPPVCGRQPAVGKHHGPRPSHHGPEEHPEGLLHARRHHRHRAAAAGPRHVRGTDRPGPGPDPHTQEAAAWPDLWLAGSALLPFWPASWP